MHHFSTAVAFALSITLAGGAHAAEIRAGGRVMSSGKDIVENVALSAELGNLGTAIKATNMGATLKGKGPFTVFAPTNAAFAKLPVGTLETLLRPESKPVLGKVLAYHVLPGKYDFDALQAEIQKQNGRATLTTLSGGKLSFIMNGKHNIAVLDQTGNTANISIYDAYQANGVINVIDSVLMPK